ncbi:MAG: tRNA glutamyl-Q(34) synthetase GluQRS [Ilumatobacteraceae bacterium]
MTGRFAPSPTGPLHVGNIRTALVAWLLARSSADHRFLIRVEDLDRANSSRAKEAQQLADLARIGLDWDPPVVRQSERFDRYDAAIAGLTAAGSTYECFCSRREIREAVAAPHVDDVAYPGTCRELSASERAARRSTRPPAVRLRSTGEDVTIHDAIAGSFTGRADDVVLRRNDGVPAYNLAVVVDDAAQGVTDVVRGDDLLPSTPRQVVLQRLLGLPPVRYVHVPLVVGADGHRLAKRDGAVTLDDLGAAGVPPERVVGALGSSLGLGPGGRAVLAGDLLDGFDLGVVVARGRRPVDLDDLQRSWS